MENAFSIIERCCDQVEAQGIQIVRGPLFDWTGPDKNVPKACDGLGAVLWCNGGRVEKPWTALRKLLHVDNFWLYRFCIGWDNQHQLVYYTDHPGRDGGPLVAHPDEVSRLARRLSKERTR